MAWIFLTPRVFHSISQSLFSVLLINLMHSFFTSPTKFPFSSPISSPSLLTPPIHCSSVSIQKGAALPMSIDREWHIKLR